MTITIQPKDEALAELAILRNLGPSILDNLISELSIIKLTSLRPKYLRPAIEKALEGHKEHREVVFRQILGLHSLCRNNDLSASDVVAGLSDGLQKLKNTKDWNEAEFDEWQKLKPKLVQLLDIDNVRIVVKAMDLQTEYANLYRSSRIITDIRPIFSRDDKSIVGTVISHTLRLYYENREDKHDLSITLDEEDIINLRKSCDRALIKVKTAKNTASEKLGVPSIIIGEE